MFFMADFVTSHEQSTVPPSNVSECPAKATQVFRWKAVDASKLCTCEKFRAHRRTNDARRRDDVTKIATFQHSCQPSGAESLFGLSHESW